MQDLDVYKKRSGSADTHGVFYEQYMSLLLFTRAKKNAWQFKMAYNMLEACDFDDIVISFPSKTFFIQLKHKTNSQTISASSLQSLTGQFPLFKYFKSYCLLKERQRLSCLGKFEDFVFVIYTNASLQELMKTCSCSLEEEWINFLHTGGEAHCFNAGHFKKLIEFLDKREMYTSLLQKAIKSVSLLSSEEEHDLVTYIQTFSNNGVKTLPDSKELQKELNRIMDLFQTREDGKVKQIADMTSSSFESFLKQLVFFSDQSSEQKTEKIILEELEQLYMKEISDKSHIDKMRKKFQELADKEHYITHASNFWDSEIINPWILELSKEILEELKPLLKITFSDEEYKHILLHQVQVNLADRKAAKLSLLKIHQRLKSEPHIMMTWKKFCDQRQQVLSLWERWCDILVLEMEPKVNIKNVIQQMKYILKDGKKRLVFVTEYRHRYPKVRTINDSGSVWKGLSEESKQKLLDVKVVVQGTETTFGQAVGQEIDKWKQLVRPSFLLHLMNVKEPIHFGSKLKQPDIYIPRPLQRFETLNDSVLQIPDAKFIFSGISEVDFQRRFSVGTLKRFSRINTDTAVDLNSLAQEFKDKSVHQLHYNESALVWKQSAGDMSDLVKHVNIHSATPKTYDPEEILNKPRMLLTAESGMGKSTFLSQMAAEIKRCKGGAIWIAKINLENHRHAFDNSASLSKLLDLMLAARKGPHLYNKLDKVFLEMMLKAGRVAVFCDGFNEVLYYDKVLDILRNLLQCYPDIILWIASRPVAGGRLETFLQMLPYSLPYLKYADQEKYLLQKWNREDLNILHVKEFIKNILTNVCMHPRGVPLLLLIISDTFQEELIEFVKYGKKFTAPNGVDNVFLHEKYITKQLENYCKSNKVNKKMKPIIETFYMENHMLFSLAEVIDINELEIASYLNIKISSLDRESIQDMGIIHESSSGRSSFLHRSFAEYFIALWFKIYHQSNVSYLRSQIFESEFQPIRKFLDCLLAKELTLHSEIIKGKKDINLPHAKVAINSEDFGGRTPLHLLVLNYRDEMFFGNTNSSFSLAEKLLDRGANPNSTDRMLNWSCAQYALYAETWALLDLMLRYRVDRNCLNSIKDKLSNTSGKDALLSAIATDGFIHLLHHVLKYVDVNEYVTHRRVLKTMLHIAVEAKNMEVVKKLVHAGADVNLQMKKRFENGTALHIAAQKGDLKIAQHLLAHRASLNVTGAFNRDPIEEAAVFSKWKMVCYLSDRAKRVAYTPLVCAVRRGKLSVVRHLINKNVIQHHENINVHQKDDLMNLAIVKGKLDIVKYLVSQGLTLNKDHPSLMEAAKFGMLGVVKYLIQNGAAVNTSNAQGHTPLHVALVSGKRKTANYLRKVGGTFSSRKLEIEAFHETVRLGNTKTLSIFLENIHVDVRDKAGWTALHNAAWVGNDKVICFLLSKNANINAVTQTPSPPPSRHTYYFNSRAPHLVGYTALHLAAARGKLTAVELLIDRNADIERYNKDGEMALHVAACRGHYSLLPYLCTEYDVNKARTRKSDLVLHCAIRHKNMDVVRCLTEECDADVNAKGRNGSTPLCLAVEYNNVPLVLHLLHRGADINGRDGAGNTPLILSVRNTTEDIMRILLKRGAATDSQNKKGSTALHVAAGSLDYDSVTRLTYKGIDIDIRDKKGRTALDIALQRSRKRPDCRAVRHRNTFGWMDMRCICVNASDSMRGRLIVSHLQRIIKQRK